MCNWYAKATQVLNRGVGGTVSMNFPPEFFQRFPVQAALRGHCLICQRPLSPQEMFPMGKTPRYMCEPCYQRIAYSGPKYTCLTCGKPLSAEQIRNQIQNPRELGYAIHSGLCDDYHTILAGIVLGALHMKNSQPMLPQHVNNGGIPFSQFFPSNQRPLDYIDVEPVAPRKQVKYLKLPE